MRQGLKFPLLGAMLLCIGLAAGTLIPAEARWLLQPHSSTQPDPQTPPTAAQSIADPVALTNADTGTDITSLRPLPSAPATPFTPAPKDAADPVIRLAAASSTDDHDATRQLIQQAFPDADAATVNVWAETFHGMSPAEISDILEQKKLLSGSLDAIFTPDLKAPETTAPLQPVDTSRDQERAAARRNLRHAWTVGYRRRLVLPAAQTDSPATTPGTHDFIDFSSGRRVRSPRPLHAAIAENPLHMFLLHNGTLTRRGDFSTLPDGHIGLITPDGPQPLHTSPVTGDPQQHLRMLENGELQAAAGPDSWNNLGRVTVVEVLRPDLLTTKDGVHFNVGAPHAYRELLPGEIRLLPGTLELSNVDPTEELQRLDALDR
ncbi:MAG: hypothetical protein RLZZ436_1201 [Planctomycetota bacterium]